MEYTALICARGGSKGLPGKNIRMLAGRPLIGWAIHVAQQVEKISRIIVSTDSEEIAQIAEEQGATVPFIRPSYLAEDDSPEWLVWRHALQYLLENKKAKIDGLVSVPATAPLRSPGDIEKCITEFEKGDSDCVITVSDAHRSPYFNMIKHDEEEYAHLVLSPEKKITRRQDVPVVYDMTTVAYVVRPEFVLHKDSLFDGRVRSVIVPPERAIDIDTILDFQIAECLLAQRYGDST